MEFLRALFARQPPSGEGEAPAAAEPGILFESALALAQDGDHEGAVLRLREAVRLRPTFAAAYCNMGLSLQELGRGAEAREMLRRAVELDPINPDYAANLRIVSSHSVPLWHFSMMNDRERNEGYEAAIRAAIAPGAQVLEIGTGSGLLAMMAVRAGAGHVVTCEADARLAEKAREIVALNGFAGKVTVVAKHSTALRIPEDLPARADVLVSEIISSDLIGEGLLSSYEDAKQRLLKPGATMIPQRASVRGRLVAAEGIEASVKVGDVAGFNLRAFNDFGPIKVHPGEVDMRVRPLSEAFDIFSFDLQAAEAFSPERNSIRVEATGNGSCAGVLQWIRLELGGGAVYENADTSLRRSGHWQQVLHLFAPPVEVQRGDVVTVGASHNRGNLVFTATR